jgi:urease accessory protein
MSRLARAALATALTLVPGLAFAHVGAGDTHGFAHGFMHPIGGLDHVLAMVGVGLFASRLGGRALWLVPLAFVAMMGVGGAVGMAGIGLPYVEIGIAASVIVLGLAVALQLGMPLAAAMAAVGLFAVFHGHAHGAEMPADAAGLSYGAGFIVATALLHGAGLALGVTLSRLATTPVSKIALRLGGGAMALAGVGLLSGAF